jgi:hypothetical protein
MSTATDLQSLVKVGAVTFAGAFFGSLTLNGGIPTTLAQAKIVLAPALGAAIAAEVIYLRKLFAAALPPAQPAPPTTPAPSPTLPTDVAIRAKGIDSK